MVLTTESYLEVENWFEWDANPWLIKNLNYIICVMIYS